MNKGLIHVYCGEGKGKTTAAIGLALRASGSGMKVVLVQFLKGREVSELESLRKLQNIKVLRNEKDLGFYRSMNEEEKALVTEFHNANLNQALKMVEENQCDLLILDEIMAAYRFHLVDQEMVRKVVMNKKSELELVLTGREPADFFLEYADYISEIKKVRHPFDKKVPARKGIEF